MQSIYSIRISLDSEELYSTVSEILNVKPKEPDLSTYWIYEITEKESDEFFDFINEFLDILEPKLNEFLKIGIKGEDINLWFLYEYRGQCNMEFNPERLGRLGSAGIGLCISCWEGGE